MKGIKEYLDNRKELRGFIRKEDIAGVHNYGMDEDEELDTRKVIKGVAERLANKYKIDIMQIDDNSASIVVIVNDKVFHGYKNEAIDFTIEIEMDRIDISADIEGTQVVLQIHRKDSEDDVATNFVLKLIPTIEKMIKEYREEAASMHKDMGY